MIDAASMAEQVILNFGAPIAILLAGVGILHLMEYVTEEDVEGEDSDEDDDGSDGMEGAIGGGVS